MFCCLLLIPQALYVRTRLFVLLALSCESNDNSKQIQFSFQIAGCTSWAAAFTQGTTVKPSQLRLRGVVYVYHDYEEELCHILSLLQPST